MDDCKVLLSELSGRLKQHPPYRPLSDCNVFQELGVAWDERRMCRFLANLLDPEGDHGFGILFLSTFLQAVLPECPMSGTLLAHTAVTTEFPLENGRRIDIVLENARYFIPIEVKIGAVDQEGQCYDYYQHAKNAPLIYLTRFASAPSEYSRTKPDGSDSLPLNRVRRVSWAKDIAGWLTSLLPQLDGPVKSLVEQFIDAIHKIADKGEHRRMEESVQAALASPEFFRAGLELERSMKQAKLSLLRGVFDCFREEMEPIAAKYGLELEREARYYSYEAPQHDTFYDFSSTTWPGLNYVVKGAKFQKESLQMWFRIEVDHQLFAGFALFDTGAMPQDGYPKGYQVDEITPELVEEAARYLDREVISPTDWWLAWCYPNGKHQVRDYPDVPNFKTMNPCTVELVDSRGRKEFVRQAVGVFETHILRHLMGREERVNAQ